MVETLKRRFRMMSNAVTRTIFTKFLLVTTSIILISCVILGVVTYIFVADRWRTEKLENLSSNARNTADLAGSLVDLSVNKVNGQMEYVYTFNRSLPLFVSTIADSMGGDVFVVNLEGDVQICSDASDMIYNSDQWTCKHKEHIFSQKFLNEINTLSTEYRATSTLDGIYSENYYIVAMPIYANDPNGKKVVIGTVFTATTAGMVSTFADEILRVIIITIVIVSIIGILLMYVLTYKMIKPIRQMEKSAEAFGMGDFSSRVPVITNDEVGRLAIAFNNMAGSLAMSENVSRSFIANVSHELKTPMTTISGFIDGILDGTISPEQEKKYLHIVSDEVKRLSRLVRSMLVLSKIDSGEMKLNPVRVDVTGSVCSSLLSFEQAIEKKNISIEGVEDIDSIYAEGDPDLLYQVSYNLFENAVKFTNEGGTISIKIRNEDSKVYVAIRNTGSGIASDEIIHIFEKFYKTDKSRSQDKTGVGLGLYIVKTIVELHGGKIKADSSEGEYCEFEFYIPERQINS